MGLLLLLHALGVLVLYSETVTVRATRLAAAVA